METLRSGVQIPLRERLSLWPWDPDPTHKQNETHISPASFNTWARARKARETQLKAHGVDVVAQARGNRSQGLRAGEELATRK